MTRTRDEILEQLVKADAIIKLLPSQSKWRKIIKDMLEDCSKLLQGELPVYDENKHWYYNDAPIEQQFPYYLHIQRCYLRFINYMIEKRWEFYLDSDLHHDPTKVIVLDFPNVIIHDWIKDEFELVTDQTDHWLSRLVNDGITEQLPNGKHRVKTNWS